MKRGSTMRRAFVCPQKGCFRRVFLLDDEPMDHIPSCHGPMVREPNKPYMGQSTEPVGAPPARDLPR